MAAIAFDGVSPILMHNDPDLEGRAFSVIEQSTPRGAELHL